MVTSHNDVFAKQLLKCKNYFEKGVFKYQAYIFNMIR